MSDYKTALSREDVEKVISGENRVNFDAAGYWGKAWAKVQEDFGNAIIIGLIFQFLGVVGYWLTAGLFQGLYKESKGEGKADMNALFKGFDHGKPILIFLLIGMAAGFICFFFPYMITIIGAAAESPGIAIIGVILLIVGLLFLIIFSFSHFFSIGLITFAGMDAMESIKKSAAVAKNYIGGIIVYILISFGISLLCLLTCGLGFLVAIPMTYFASYYAFEDVFQLERKGGVTNEEIIDHLV